MNSYILERIDEPIVSFDTEILKGLIEQNSQKIDMMIKELKEINNSL